MVLKNCFVETRKRIQKTASQQQQKRMFERHVLAGYISCKLHLLLVLFTEKKKKTLILNVDVAGNQMQN